MLREILNFVPVQKFFFQLEKGDRMKKKEVRAKS